MLIRKLENGKDNLSFVVDSVFMYRKKPQIVSGLFGAIVPDEVMEKVSKNKTQFTLSIRREFEDNRMAEFWLADI